METSMTGWEAPELREKAWAMFTVEALALGVGFAQSIQLITEAPLLEELGAKELGREIKRTIRTLSHAHPPASAFAIRPGGADDLEVHILIRHHPIDRRTIDRVVAMSRFELKEVRDLGGIPAREEVLRLLEFPLRMTGPGQPRRFYSNQHFEMNDSCWVGTVGDFFFDGQRSLKGITEARELVAKQLGLDEE